MALARELGMWIGRLRVREFRGRVKLYYWCVLVLTRDPFRMVWKSPTYGVVSLTDAISD